MKSRGMKVLGQTMTCYEPARYNASCEVSDPNTHPSNNSGRTTKLLSWKALKLLVYQSNRLGHVGPDSLLTFPSRFDSEELGLPENQLQDGQRRLRMSSSYARGGDSTAVQ